MAKTKPVLHGGAKVDLPIAVELSENASTYPSLPIFEPAPQYVWPDTMDADFGKRLITGTHNIHQMSAFTDNGLAELLDEYPRDKLGIYRFPPHAEGRVKAEHGCAPDLSGKDLLEAVKQGDLWLNLRAVNRVLPEYAEIADTLFSQMEATSGQKTLKQDVGVLISSPNIQVHYHLDIPLVCLVQVRGEKRVHFYPVGAPFAEPSTIEAIALRQQEEELPFHHDFETACQTLTIRPGMAVTWPQTAPHRVENGNMLNVSLSCEFMTMPAILKANALVTNSKLRNYGLNPEFPKNTGLVTAAKAVMARVIKKIDPLPEKGPTPITFKVTSRNTITPVISQAPAVRTCNVKTISELTLQDEQDWMDLCQSDFQYQTPLLEPGFTKLVGSIRDDVRCILVRDDNNLVGVLAVHLRHLGYARPIGAPFCDYSGPIIAPGVNLTLSDILDLANLGAYKSSSAVTLPKSSRDPSFAEFAESYIIRLNGKTPEDYLESRRSQHAKRFKNMRGLISKLEREIGALTFHYGAPGKDDFEELLAWKSQQFVREGFLDLTKAQHSRAILDAAAALQPQDKAAPQGFMTSLRLGGKLIAGHFGLRSGENFHPWIAAYHPKFDDYSPGMLLLYRVIEMMGEMGLETYDLSDGHGSYKKYFAEIGRNIRPVFASNSTLSGRANRLRHESWSIIGGKNDNGSVARLRRRLDHIAVCEPRFLARVNEFGIAVAKRSHTSIKTANPD